MILWTQPEIILYDDDPYLRMSYPDLVEDGGRYYVTETQKDVARVHELDPALLEGLWGQFERAEVTREGLLLDVAGGETRETPLPALPALSRRDYRRADHGTLDLRAGFALDLWFSLPDLAAGRVLADGRDDFGAGLALVTTDRGTVEIVLNDGRTENRWDCDPGLLTPGKLHHLVASIDGGPKVITFVVDGRLCDGGEGRQFGWGRYSPHLRTPQGSGVLRLCEAVRHLRLYGRYLRTSEAISNYRAGV